MALVSKGPVLRSETFFLKIKRESKKLQKTVEYEKLKRSVESSHPAAFSRVVALSSYTTRSKAESAMQVTERFREKFRRENWLNLNWHCLAVL